MIFTLLNSLTRLGCRSLIFYVRVGVPNSNILCPRSMALKSLSDLPALVFRIPIFGAPPSMGLRIGIFSARLGFLESQYSVSFPHGAQNPNILSPRQTSRMELRASPVGEFVEAHVGIAVWLRCYEQSTCDARARMSVRLVL